MKQSDFRTISCFDAPSACEASLAITRLAQRWRTKNIRIQHRCDGEGDRVGAEGIYTDLSVSWLSPSALAQKKKDDRSERRLVVKYSLLAAIFAGVMLPGSASSAGDTPASPGTIVGKEGGIVNIPSKHSVDETVERLKNILRSKQITLFALIDHSGEAAKVGMKMPPTKLLIFGNPKGGTPLMLAAPSSALDLPLKILVSEDAQGKVWLSYNSPEYLKERHGLPSNLLPNIAVIETLSAAAAE